MMVKDRSILRMLPVLLVVVLGELISFVPHGVVSVVVDGTRKGPSALKNQSHEEDMIDGYNTKTCGIADPDEKTSAFVNSAKEGMFPWLVSLQVIKEKENTRAHFCMGSFISDKWILSAAHCFADE